MKTIRDSLAEWTELESVIDIFAEAYGFKEPGQRFPKHFYWTSNTVCDLLSNAIYKLVDAGILIERDGESDRELRWNSQFSMNLD